MQQSVLNEQETKLLVLRDLKLENMRLQRECQRLQQRFEKLKTVCYIQKDGMEKLENDVFENVVKLMISFLSKQSED